MTSAGVWFLNSAVSRLDSLRTSHPLGRSMCWPVPQSSTEFTTKWSWSCCFACRNHPAEPGEKFCEKFIKSVEKSLSQVRLGCCLSSFRGWTGREMNKYYLFYLQVCFPPPPEVQCLTDKKKPQNQRETGHQHSPSLQLGLMALRGITVRMFSTEEPKDKYSKIIE